MRNIIKTKNILLLGGGLLFSVWANAQASAPATELATTPPAQAEIVKEKTEATEATQPAIFNRKIQYSLSAGSMFSNGFGSAAYVRPSVLFPVTKRFTAFGSLSIINRFSPAVNNRFATDAPSPFNNSFANQQYIIHAGGNYAINNRLDLTGSVWHDLSKQNRLPHAPINLFPGTAGNGMQFRANYKITENLSVSGGFRYSNGQHYNPLYYQGFQPGGF